MRHLCFFILLLSLLVPLELMAQQPVAGGRREFPIGSVRAMDQLPAGRFRTRLEQLPPVAQERAMEWLRGFHFTEQDFASLHTDAEGGIFYVDGIPAGVEPVSEGSAPEVSAAAVPLEPFPASLIFHSRPGAPNVLYLNFAGETVVNTEWNTSLARPEIPALPFSTDTNYASFSDFEQAAIKRIWQRVAEDFAPFDVDVTTERPAVFNNRTANALITRNTDANGQANPYPDSGGVAYVNVFNSSQYARYRPAWVYHNNLNQNESFIAEAASHEIGHNLGLSHDGRTDGSEYYGGHGSGDISWGPLMGTGYNRNVSQWTKGEYYLASNTQDDLAVIAGKLAYRSDDHGNTRGTATGLVLTGGTNVISTTPENDPENLNPVNKGMLEQNSDVDVFSFVTGTGTINLTVNPWITPSGTRGGNLDVLLEIYDDSGTLRFTNNVSTKTTASIQTNVTGGRYYLYVRNSGTGTPLSSTPSGYTAYASIGQYFVSGYVVSSEGLVLSPVAELTISDVTQAGQGPHQFTVTYSDDVAVAVATLDSGDIRVTGPNGFSADAQFVSVNVANNGTPRVATYSIAPPGGGVWTTSDSGVYTVWMKTNAVTDTDGAAVEAGQLGSFSVSVPWLLYAANMSANPGWTLEGQWQYGVPAYTGNAPSSGYTGASILGYNLSGNYSNSLPATYATTPAINCVGATNVSLRFRRWLGLKQNDTASIEVSTNGVNWLNVWSTASTVADNSWQDIQYALPTGVAGSPSLRVRWGISSSPSQSDIGWNLDDVEVLGIPGEVPLVSLAVTAIQPGWGTVSPTNGSYPLGSSVEITATPATYFAFAHWGGDATGAENPINVILNSNKAVQAVFSEILTTNHPTPLWWLASHGFTNDFESAVALVGANEVPVWESYVAGLNPNDPASRLLLSGYFSVESSAYVLSWGTVTGRVYTVWSSTNLMDGFSPIPAASNLPWTISGITNQVDVETTQRFYRLEVQKP